MYQKSDTKSKFSIPDLHRAGKHQMIVTRLSQKYNQICVYNGAVNPHGKFCMHKNVLVPKVKIWNVTFNGLNLPEIKTIFEKSVFS